MQPLDKALRNKLERTVRDARRIAEAAVRAALEQIGVGEAAPFVHLSETERELRRKLRVHGRQLGDIRQPNEAQEIDRLIEEAAYEHWHRMLFARFLAENNLLIYDGVAVTLEECDELAAEEGAKNGWEFASKLASKMLPQIFRPESPVFLLILPPEHQQDLERLLADLSQEVFTASDSLGWVYQFWQAKKKDDVNESEVKIGARELPAVTQLFTEPYMVSFLLDNSLGAWWAARRLSASDLKTAATEEELRQKASLPGVALEYLRFIKDEKGNWTPAAGTFDAWPKQLSELKTLDPCCGSGHFLVAAFLMLVAMRIELDKLSARDAVDAVLRENIHGLELDQRCVELAAFALALAAWRYPDDDGNALGYRPLPELNIACSGLSVSAAKEEWKQLAVGKQNLRIALDSMYEVFKDAPVLGSLLNPARTVAAQIMAEGDELSLTLKQALAQEQTTEQLEATVVAKGLSKAAMLLAGKYNWVITNVPYLARGKQDERLRAFCERQYPEAKNDLATVFLDRCLELCIKGGSASIVLPQNWLFLTSYKKFREKLLKNDTWHIIARLGPQAFQTPMWDFNVQLITLSQGKAEDDSVLSFTRQDTDNLIRGLDVSEPRTASEKAAGLLTAEIKTVAQSKQLENPDARVILEDSTNGRFLAEYAETAGGQCTFDSPRFIKNFWESGIIDNIFWILSQTPSSSTDFYTGRTNIIRWENGVGALYELVEDMKRGGYTSGIWKAGVQVWGYKGIFVNLMGALNVSIYSGTSFDNNSGVLIPKNDKDLIPLWCYCSSPEFRNNIRKIDQALKVTNANLKKVQIDLTHWSKIAEEKYPNGLPKPYSDDPTQWIFHGDPCGSVIWDDKKKWTSIGEIRVDENVLQVAVARLLGYRWPAELDAKMELADEQRELVKRCDALLPFADSDGIVCIPPVRGEASASDRLLNVLAAAYGDTWSNDILSRLLKQVDNEGKTLEIWLRDKFFVQHCKLFQHRPFIWHIWDGLRDGFSALINYHKLDRKNMESLIYTYLGDWISRQKQDMTQGIDGAQEKLVAAENLKKKLELILEGEAPYDIFVRWKPLDKQPVGWEPDLNDGVRLNIRPFMSVTDVAKRGAGILRDKPNIKWDKDRGKDVESAPWYAMFNGDRINDHHLSLAEKMPTRNKEL